MWDVPQPRVGEANHTNMPVNVVWDECGGKSPTVGAQTLLKSVLRVHIDDVGWT